MTYFEYPPRESPLMRDRMKRAIRRVVMWLLIPALAYLLLVAVVKMVWRTGGWAASYFSSLPEPVWLYKPVSELSVIELITILLFVGLIMRQK